ncbi:MAG: SIS domain-containing protein [Clostridia bacterium]|nr:SIS domain-containing protein [Clostridia bacterium]
MSLLLDEICEQPQILMKLGKESEKTVKAIADEYKKRGLEGVYFAARGTSDHACVYAQYIYAITAGIPCELGTPSVVTKYGAKINYGRRMVICVSQSGKAEDVLGVLKQANDQGCLTVAVTNDVNSPLAKAAEYHLFCSAKEEVSIAATKTFTAQMYLLALLCAEISGSKELKAQLDEVGQRAAELLKYAPAALEAKVTRYRYVKNAFILGRGLEYPIALEGALKILETNAIKMKGAAISDFYHGPIAQVCEDDLVIVVAGKGAVYDDALKMIAKLHEIGAEVFVITDSEDLIKEEKYGILTPDAGEFAAPFMFAICVQLFAYSLTAVRGIDPNVSKVLKKITITK